MNELISGGIRRVTSVTKIGIHYHRTHHLTIFYSNLASVVKLCMHHVKMEIPYEKLSTLDVWINIELAF